MSGGILRELWIWLKCFLSYNLKQDNILFILSIIMDSIMDKPFYKKSNFKLYQANCLELLTQIPENSIDMVFADPPYFLSKKLRLVKKF